MPILQTDESMKNNSHTKDKHLTSGDNSPLKEKLLLKGENTNEFLFFPKEKNRKYYHKFFINRLI